MKYLSNPDMLLGLMRQMLSGMEVTLPLFFYTLIFSLPLGVIVALMRMCKLKIVSVPTRVCILVLRGTPLILQIFFRILLPQLFKRSLLPVSNEVVTLVKDTALVTCIALCDMYYYAKKATSATGSLLPLFLAGAFYLLMNTVVEVVFDRLNKRMDYYRG